MNWWLVTDFDQTAHGTVTARWVQANTPQGAAEAALPYLEEDWHSRSVEEVLEHVFVAAVPSLTGAPPRIAFDVYTTVRRAVLQCCGGIGGGRHSALCTEARDDEKGAVFVPLHEPGRERLSTCHAQLVDEQGLCSACGLRPVDVIVVPAGWRP